MTKIIIDIDNDGKECGDCFWKKYLDPPSIIFLRCNLFNVTLDHYYNDKAELIGKRCKECLERAYKAR